MTVDIGQVVAEASCFGQVMTTSVAATTERRFWATPDGVVFEAPGSASDVRCITDEWSGLCAGLGRLLDLRPMRRLEDADGRVGRPVPPSAVFGLLAAEAETRVAAASSIGAVGTGRWGPTWAAAWSANGSWRACRCLVQWTSRDELGQSRWSEGDIIVLHTPGGSVTVIETGNRLALLPVDTTDVWVELVSLVTLAQTEARAGATAGAADGR